MGSSKRNTPYTYNKEQLGVARQQRCYHFSGKQSKRIEGEAGENITSIIVKGPQDAGS